MQVSYLEFTAFVYSYLSYNLLQAKPLVGKVRFRRISGAMLVHIKICSSRFPVKVVSAAIPCLIGRKFYYNHDSAEDIVIMARDVQVTRC
jgi:hypothetical protein